MNGRVYDPTLGRFLSADPTIASPTDLQSYNRYAYVLNNPLRYTDPTGYWSWGWTSIVVNAALTVGAIAICAGSEGAACGVSFMLLGMAYNTTAMAIQGASIGQIIFTDMLSLFGGAYGGVIGGGVASGLGGGAGAQILGGAIAGMVTSAIGASSVPGLSGKGFGEALLIGAASGAGAAALSYGVAYVRHLSQASAAAAQGSTAPSPEIERMAKFLRQGGFQLDDPTDSGRNGGAVAEVGLTNAVVKGYPFPDLATPSIELPDAKPIDLILRGTGWF